MSLDIYLETPYNCPHCGKHIPGHGEEMYTSNITHNLGKMAGAAGIYNILWHPEDNDIQTASQLIAPLESAIEMMKRSPGIFQAYDSPNGWGKYEHFLPWIESLLSACREYPDCVVRASR